MKTSILFLILWATSLFAADYDFPDPYPEVYTQVELLPPLYQSFALHEAYFAPLLEQRDFYTVIEVGVWLGSETHFIASRLPKRARFFAVDHWKGSVEHQSSPVIPTLFQQFLSNMIHLGLTDKVIPVRMDSLEAAKKFAGLGIKADLIYIDASHDYDSVLADLRAWYPLIDEEGIFCGDDWADPGVERAVRQFAEEEGLTITLQDTNSWTMWQLSMNLSN